MSFLGNGLHLVSLSVSISLGKLITRTKVVDIKSLYRPFSFKILVRTLNRFILFEFKNFFTKKQLILYDHISRTIVIKSPEYSSFMN
jgi:hypothetical protein